MRITIITGPFQPLPPGEAGAVEKLWFDLGNQFGRFGHEVTMISKASQGRTAATIPNTRVRLIGCEGFRRSRFLAVDLGSDLAYSVHAAALLPQSDIVVTNTFWLPVCLAFRTSRLPQIVVAVERFPKGQLWLYWRAARLRANSSAVADAIRRQVPWMRHKVRMIPNPVDLDSFAPSNESRTTSSPVVLYAGRIHPEKGLELLVQAVRVLAQRREHVSLRLIGPLSVAEGGAGPSYARHLRDLAGEARIELQEPIYDRRRLCGEFHRATCFCYPSVAERGESFGVAPLEAMASGLPPVVSALACFQEFVTHGETGLIFDHRASDPVERLAESLESVLFNDALRIRMKEAGTRRARDFSTPRIAEMFLEDFEQLLSRGRQV